MNESCPSRVTDDCPARVVCRCLQVTEAELLTAVNALGLRSLNDVRTHTGAGDGCTCCHKLLCQYLEQHARRGAVALATV
jgi:bacterioferritin-associated ferredoxin